MSFIMYKQNADLYRLSKESADQDKEKYGLIYAGLKVNIQPAGLEYTAMQPDGAIGKLFRCFTTYSGCQIGMILVSSGTTTISGSRYEVTGVEGFTGPLGRTFELLVRKSTN